MSKKKAITLSIFTILIIVMLFISYKIGTDTIGFNMFKNVKTISASSESDEKVYTWLKDMHVSISLCAVDTKEAKEDYDFYFAKLPEDSNDWGIYQNEEEARRRSAYTSMKNLTVKDIEAYNLKALGVDKSVLRELPSEIRLNKENELEFDYADKDE